MDRIWQMLADFNVISVTVRLLLAAVLGGIIGLERGIHGRAAGLRTHLLVCVGAALTALTGLYISQEMNLGGMWLVFPHRWFRASAFWVPV